jgi:hypothetical protein
MEFERRKLRLALIIIATGLIVALIWHGWMGWGRGLGYPYNTFLFFPDFRFTDFTEYFGYARTFDPYRGPLGRCNNMPASYLLLYPLLWMPTATAAFLFLGFGLLGLLLLLYVVFQDVVPHPGWRLFTAMVFLGSYPVLYALDRGNNDLVLVPLVALSLFLYSRGRFTLSFLCLLPPVCCKLYPALLLLLFFRRKQIHWLFLGPLAFLLVNWAALLTFHGPVSENWANLQMQLRAYNLQYSLGQYGVASSASAWNLLFICVWLFFAVSSWNFGFQMPPDITLNAFYVYNGFFLLLLIWMIVHVLWVEKFFVRKAILLLLYLTVSIPSGGDYKLMYAEVALVILILVREKRPADLVVTAMLALALVPKREVLLTFLGRSDSGYFDASLNVIVNPLCLLIAMAMLMWDGWRAAGALDGRRRLTPARPRP